MAIIVTTTERSTPSEQFLNIYPNQFKTDKEKENPDWIKRNMDYFYTVAVNQFAKNHKAFVRNYELLKGVLRREDFYEDQQLKSFTEDIIDADKLPSYVQHYSIMTPPINTLIGEMSKRPDNVFVKAFDDDSKSEEGQFRTQIVSQYIIDKAKSELEGLMAQHGVSSNDPDELEKMTEEKVKEYMTSYTSLAEKWGARMLEALKMNFNIKEKSEDSFRDLLVSAREFIHIFEDKSSLGFGMEVLNPKNVWWLTTPDEKYISDPLDKNAGSYAAGTIHIMEMSEILQKFDLTEEEVEHMRQQSQQAYLIDVRESNLVKTPTGSYDSITYDTYDPLILQQRLLMEAQLKENHDELDNFLGITSSAGTFGNKYMVVRAYWCSKKKIGKLTYIDETGQIISTLVDENYKNKSHPGQIEIKWGWTNQWYCGYRIGIDIYYVKALEILDYCPIIGSVFENKNTEPRSLVDAMKPFQALYNVFMNKLWETASKDWGNVILTSIRHIPILKDGDPQDSLEQFEETVKQRGVFYTDDSPENTKGQSGFNQHTVLQASRVQELQGYYQMAASMKLECWELVGISKERLGSIAATQTATATNTALTQSYSQTEPWFVHHEYFMNKVYQALLDAALYTQSKQPTSTLSFISNEGEQAFVQVNGSDLKMRELMVFVTSRAEDARTFTQLQQLSQSMLQNGATPAEVATLFTTKSLRHLQDVFKANQEKIEGMQQAEQQQKQQQLDQQQKQFQQEQQLQIEQKQQDTENDNFNKEQDRISKEKIALIGASAKGGPDIIPGDEAALDTTKLDQQKQKNEQDYQLKRQQIEQKQQEILHSQAVDQQKLQLEKQKIQAEERRTKSQERIAKMNKANKPKK